MKYNPRKIFHNDWYDVLLPFTRTSAFEAILDKINDDLASGVTVFPPKIDVFRAFNECSFVNTKVVWLGLDPYKNSGEANGLSMATSGEHIPPSLENLMREYKTDIEGELDPELITYAHRGVLFLNTALTVRKGETGSHLELWEPFTRFVFYQLDKKIGLTFLLLGKEAQKFAKYLGKHHTIIKAVHPVAESYNPGAGFFGSRIFSQVNLACNKYGHESIFKRESVCTDDA